MKQTSNSAQAKAGIDFRNILRVLGNSVRVEILELLLRSEMASLSEINKRLEIDLNLKMTLPAVLKHMRLLEKAGIVREESGYVLPEPDARKTVYLLEGKERVAGILEELDTRLKAPLVAGAAFSKTARLARRISSAGRGYAGEAKELESLLSECESKDVYDFLTDDEKKKLKLWRMMIRFVE